MGFNTTFNNISVMVETGVPGENNNLPQVTDKLYHIIFYLVHLAMNGVRTLNVQGSYTFLLSKIKDFSRTFQDKNYSFQAPFSEHFHI